MSSRTLAYIYNYIYSALAQSHLLSDGYDAGIRALIQNFIYGMKAT